MSALAAHQPARRSAAEHNQNHHHSNVLPAQLALSQEGAECFEGGGVYVLHLANLLLDVSSARGACRRGASRGIAVCGRAHQKGRDFRIRHAFSFVPCQRVIQLVIPLHFFMKALMKQLELTGLMCRLDAPAVVDPKLVSACKTYREAVRLCWDLRRVKNLTKAALAERAGLYPSHMTCYLEDGKTTRDLPGWAVNQFEWECGNTAISQWFNVGAKLAVVEEMSFLRMAA